MDDTGRLLRGPGGRAVAEHAGAEWMQPSLRRNAALHAGSAADRTGWSARTRSRARNGRAPAGCRLLQAERLDPDAVLLRVARVHAVCQRLDHGQQRGVRANERRCVRRVVQPDPGQPRDLGQGRVGDRQGRRLAMARKLYRPRDQRMRPPGGQADDQRPLVDPIQAPEGLLRRARDDLRPQVEQQQQVSKVAGAETPSGRCRRSAPSRPTRSRRQRPRHRSARACAPCPRRSHGRPPAPPRTPCGRARTAARRQRASRCTPGGRRRYSSRAACWSSGKPSNPSARQNRTTLCSRTCWRAAPAPRRSPRTRPRRGDRRCTARHPSAHARTRRS